MKNKILMGVVFAIICVGLCVYIGINRYSKQHEEKIAFLNMQISAFEANYNMGESNRYMLNAFYAKDGEEAKNYVDEAIKLVLEADEKMKNVIPTPNFIEEEMEKLQENYKKTSNIIHKLPDLSEEEMLLVEEGAYTHVYLLKCFTSFSNLYNIRKFDDLPEKEANKTLKETWWEFGFEENIECPDTIEKEELYYMWARQWLEEELTDETIAKIESLRENDNLISKECNKKWMDFINEFCSKEKMDTN